MTEDGKHLMISYEDRKPQRRGVCMIIPCFATLAASRENDPWRSRNTGVTSCAKQSQFSPHGRKGRRRRAGHPTYEEPAAGPIVQNKANFRPGRVGRGPGVLGNRAKQTQFGGPGSGHPGWSCKTNPISAGPDAPAIPLFQCSRPEPFVRNKPNLDRDQISGVRGQWPDTRNPTPEPWTFVQNKANCPRMSGNGRGPAGPETVPAGGDYAKQTQFRHRVSHSKCFMEKWL